MHGAEVLQKEPADKNVRLRPGSSYTRRKCATPATKTYTPAWTTSMQVSAGPSRDRKCKGENRPERDSLEEYPMHRPTDVHRRNNANEALCSAARDTTK